MWWTWTVTSLLPLLIAAAATCWVLATEGASVADERLPTLAALQLLSPDGVHAELVDSLYGEDAPCVICQETTAVGQCEIDAHCLPQPVDACLQCVVAQVEDLLRYPAQPGERQWVQVGIYHRSPLAPRITTVTPSGRYL